MVSKNQTQSFVLNLQNNYICTQIKILIKLKKSKMKKIIALFTVLAFMLNMAVAQEAPKKKEKAEPAKKEVKAEKAKKEEKAEPAKTDAKAEPAKTEKSEKAAPMKKDGTPDKRFKENKEAKKESGPLKKDGTPDKRFKENKEKKEVEKK